MGQRRRRRKQKRVRAKAEKAKRVLMTRKNCGNCKILGHLEKAGKTKMILKQAQLSLEAVGTMRKAILMSRVLTKRNTGLVHTVDSAAFASGRMQCYVD